MFCSILPGLCSPAAARGQGTFVPSLRTTHTMAQKIRFTNPNDRGITMSAFFQKHL